MAEHRGHGLGLSLKLVALDALRCELPLVATIRTWNAASNTPMLRVNPDDGVRGHRRRHGMAEAPDLTAGRGPRWSGAHRGKGSLALSHE